MCVITSHLLLQDAEKYEQQLESDILRNLFTFVYIKLICIEILHCKRGAKKGSMIKKIIYALNELKILYIVKKCF